MITTKDKILNDCHSSTDISSDEFLKDCEKAVNTSDLHSDEWSSDDEALARDEKEHNKRPARLSNTNSVIKVLEKKWRSTRVRKAVKLLQLHKTFIHNYIFLLLD